jgi:hypothetical protein
MSKKNNFLFPVLLLILSACTSHYMVRDPETGNRYYTTEVERTGYAGAVTFKDRATGSKVTIQQSEIHRISEDQYEAAVKGHD